MANIEIGGRLHSTATGNVVAGANEILDDTKGKKQNQINAETDATLADHGVGIRSLNSQNYVTVDTYGNLPETGSQDAVYRVCNWDGAYNSGEGQVDSTKYTEYAWAGTEYRLLSVKSGMEEVFDVSQYNATGGSYATYESLEDLLANHVADIPSVRRKGGMSIKFIQGNASSSDNKYVQYRLVAQNFTTDIAQWQVVDRNKFIGQDALNRYISELYIHELPSGVIYCAMATNEDSLFIYSAGTDIYAKIRVTGNLQNNKVYELKVYFTDDPTNYPIGKTVASVVFNDVSSLLSDSSVRNGGGFMVNREFCSDLSNFPIIVSNGTIKEFEQNNIESGAPVENSNKLIKSGSVFDALYKTVKKNPVVPGPTQDYSEVVEELYVCNLPDGNNVVFAQYSGNAVLFVSDIDVIARYISPSENGVVYPLEIYLSNDQEHFPIGAIAGYVIFKDVTSFLAKTEQAPNVLRNVAFDISNSVKILTSNILAGIPINNGEITANNTELSRTNKVFDAAFKTVKFPVIPGSTQDYSEDIEELLITKLPAGDNVILGCWQNRCILYVSGIDVYARTRAYPINGNVYPFEVYNTNDPVNYPIDTIVGYVVLKNRESFLTKNEQVPNVLRRCACNIANTPKILNYLISNSVFVTETIDVSLPKYIDCIVGDTIQLFYKGIFRCPNPYNYDIKVETTVGKQFPRYWEFTPSASNVGNVPITFKISDHNGALLGSASSTLSIMSKGQSPSANKKVLCLGASCTQNGEWVTELNRRLTGTGGTPVGDEKTNISFVGRKQVGSIHLEATGGYAFSSYISNSTLTMRFNVAPGNEPTISKEDVYAVNGCQFTVKEINISAPNGGYFSCEISDPSISIPWSGTLTRVSGTGSDTITYSSCHNYGNPFVYDGQIDIQEYADEYCGGTIDHVVLFDLNINGMSLNMTDAQILAKCDDMLTLINLFRTTFPNITFSVGNAWSPDEKGGAGSNEGVGAWADYYAIKSVLLRQVNILRAYIDNNNLGEYVSVINCMNEFDCENNYQYIQKAVNTRNATTEQFGINEVHPGTSGYMQFADSAYRNIIAELCQN